MDELFAHLHMLLMQKKATAYYLEKYQIQKMKLNDNSTCHKDTPKKKEKQQENKI